MRLDGTIRHGLDFNVGSAGSWTTSVAFGPVIVSGGSGVQSDWSETDSSSMAYIKNKPTIPAAQVQSNWNESDTSSKAYIQNKPTIPTVPTNVSAFNNDAGYLNNNFCPIIQDKRTSQVATIIADAPFSTLVDGQLLIVKLAQATVNNTSLKLTLANNTETSAIPVYIESARQNEVRVGNSHFKSTSYMFLVYNSAREQFKCLSQLDTSVNYGNMTQDNIGAGTITTAKIISPKLFHDNAYIIEETYSSGSLKANKFYDFGTVSTALTIPSLDATNDLVSNALNFYALRFIAGADSISITFPTGVIVDDEPTINTGDYVEIMINLYVENNTNHFYASIKVWQAQ